MRTKLNELKASGAKCNISPSDLKPYPGQFLDYKIKPRLLATSLLLSLDYIRKCRFRASKEAILNIELLFTNYRKLTAEYSLFKKKWVSTVEKQADIMGLQEILLEKTIKSK
jgi:hypothetical protein